MSMTFTSEPGLTRVQRPAHAYKAMRAHYGATIAIDFTGRERASTGWEGSPFTIITSDPDKDGLMTMFASPIEVGDGIVDGRNAIYDRMAASLIAHIGDKVGIGHDQQRHGIAWDGDVTIVRVRDIWAVADGIAAEDKIAAAMEASSIEIWVSMQDDVRALSVTIDGRRLRPFFGE